MDPRMYPTGNVVVDANNVVTSATLSDYISTIRGDSSEKFITLSNLFAASFPIGATTPATGAFTAITASTTLDVVGNVTVSTGNILATAGNITATAGNIVATAGDLTVTAGDGTIGGALGVVGNVTVSTGNILATAGNITATAGNIVATAGDLTVTAGDGTIGGALGVVGNVTVSTGNIAATVGDITATAGKVTSAGLFQNATEMTAGGALDADVSYLEINSATPATAINITIASPTAGRLLVITQTDSGTAGNTVTLTSGYFAATNNKATFDAQQETLVLFGISSTRFVIVENIGTVTIGT